MRVSRVSQIGPNQSSGGTINTQKSGTTLKCRGFHHALSGGLCGLSLIDHKSRGTINTNLYRLRDLYRVYQRTSVTNNFLLQITTLRKQIKDEMDTLGVSIDDYANLSHELTMANPDMRERIRTKLDLISKYSDLTSTYEYFSGLEKRKVRITQSAIMTDGIPSTSKPIENFQDMGGEGDQKTMAGDSEYFEAGAKELLQMKNILSRPIRIANGTLSMVSTNFKNVYAVWDLFTKDPTVRAKLRNFAFFKANLKIRISISGTPFHYGKMGVSYQPYGQRNNSLIAAETLWTAASPFVYLNYVSQAPGFAVMDVRENKPLEITCPFISTKPVHRLYNGAANISDVTSFEDLADAGDIHFMSMTPIRAVNGITDPPYFQIYAWMEDVELGPPTATVIQITTESGQDERETGPIEEMSTALARASGALTNVPMIGKMALASQIGFTSLAELSALFGWSKPLVNEEPIYVKNNAYQSSATLIGQDTALKLRSDPKGELLISPQLAGVDEDQLIITNIAKRNSFFTRFDWGVADLPLVSLQNIGVSPFICTFSVTTGTAQQVLQPTAMCFAATPFEYWRGTIELTVEIACTQFHRGKLLIGYEPNVESISSFSGNIKLNKQYQQIIDIQETQKVTFTVDWNQPRAWLQNPGSNAEFVQQYGASFVPLPGNMNGVVYIAPFTELIAPDSTSPVRILLSACCPDLMVCYPSTTLMPTKRVITESAMEQSSTSVAKVPLSKSSASTKMVSLQHFGEEILSFRSLLKRYVTTDGSSVTCSITSVPTTLTISCPNMQFRGPRFDSTPATILHEFFTYLRYAYLGVRGSVKRRYFIIPPGPILEHLGIVVSLNNPANIPYGTNGNTQTDYSTAQGVLSNLQECTGSAVFDRDSNGAIEVELPFYSNNLFAFAFANNYVGTNVNDKCMNQVWPGRHTVKFTTSSNTSTTYYWSTASSAGEDFDFMRFQGAPLYVI